MTGKAQARLVDMEANRRQIIGQNDIASMTYSQAYREQLQRDLSQGMGMGPVNIWGRRSTGLALSWLSG
eukprot:6201583-Alexandrium_andersonii.AAC.1